VGQVIRGPQRQLVHRGQKSAARTRERVGDRNRWTDLHVAQHQTTRLEIAEPFGQDGVAYSL
jgi:hypothetical protein